MCEHLTNSSLDDHSLLDELFKGLSVYANFTGQTKCLNVDQQADQSLGDMGWDFQVRLLYIIEFYHGFSYKKGFLIQACTEMVMPMCADGVNDMFESQPWNLEKYSARCLKKWKVNPRALMAPLMYGGRNITSSSNIVFSNGLLDPWLDIIFNPQ